MPGNDNIPFDYQGAKSAGYSDQEIQGFLKDKYNFQFDITGAKQSGYSDKEIGDYITNYKAQPSSGESQKTASDYPGFGIHAVENPLAPELQAKREANTKEAKFTVNKAYNSSEADKAIKDFGNKQFADQSKMIGSYPTSEKQPVPSPDLKMLPSDADAYTEAFRIAHPSNSPEGKAILKEVIKNTKDPAEKTKLQSHLLINDRGSNYNEDTYNKVNSGKWGYDPTTGRPTVKMNPAEAFINGVETQYQNENKADFLANATKEEAIAQAEKDRQEAIGNIDKATPEATGYNIPFTSISTSSLAGSIGENINPFLKNALAASTAEVGGELFFGTKAAQFATDYKYLKPGLSAVIFGHDAGKQALSQTYNEVYNNLRDQNIAPEQAHDEAIKQGSINGALAAGQMAAMGYAGVKIGNTELPGTIYNKGFKTLLQSHAQNIAPFLKKLIPEATIQGTIAGVTKGLMNLNQGKPLSEGVAEQTGGAALFVSMLSALGSGAHAWTKRGEEEAVNGFARSDESLVDHSINEAVIQEHKYPGAGLTPEQADALRLRIQKQRELNKGIPYNAPIENIQKIRNRLDKIDELKKSTDPESIQALHDIFKPVIKEKINAAAEEVNNLSDPANGSNEPLEKTKKEQIQELIDKKAVNGKIGQYETSDHDELLKNIAEQAHGGMTVDGKFISSRPLTEEMFGKELVDISTKTHPEHIISEPKIETNGTETKEAGEQTDETKPVGAVKIQPNKDLRTLDYGEWKGKPESKESKEEIKQEILSGKPVGKTGETLMDFANRAIPAAREIIDNPNENETIVTHSSVIKALNAWDDMGRPDKIDESNIGDFSKKYVEEKPEPEGGLNTFKSDKNETKTHILRHGETEDNKFSEFRHDDTNLTDKGQGQANRAGEALNKATGGNITTIHTSDLPRAKETSDIISNQLKSKENATPIRSDKGQLSSEGGRHEGRENISSKNIQQSKSEETRNGATEQQAGSGKPEEKGKTEGEKEPSNVTRITHAVIDAERKDAGLPEVPKGSTKHDAETLQKALKKVGGGYSLEDMIAEFSGGKKASDDDSATLLVLKKNIEDQRRTWNDALNKAVDSGDDVKIAEAQTKKARILDDFDKIGQLSKKFGSEAGLALRAQRLGLNEDYSLASMISQKRAANGGRQLTDTEKVEIENRFNAIQQRVKELEDKVKELQDRKPPKSIKLKGKELADKIRGLRPKAGSAQANILGLPVAIYDTAIVTVANAVEKGAELIDAISEGVKYLKAQGYIAKTKDQRDFRQHIYDHVGEGVEFKNILTPESIKATAALAREQNAFDADILKDENKTRSNLDKVLDVGVSWQRAFKLAWPTTLAKLTSAAMTRLVQSPIEDVIGKGVDIAFPSMAARATGESGFNIKAQAKLFTKTFTQGMKDSYDIMSKEGFGKSDIDMVFGGRKVTLPPEAVQFFGRLHSALKAPIKRGIFERSLQKRLENNMKIGNDVEDPNVQMRIATQAYKDSNRAIFMQDNKIADAYKAAVNTLERSGEGGQLAAAVAKWMIPFVKVPTNILGESVTSTPAGLAMAGFKMMHIAFTKGMKNMSEDEADMIYRMIKKGSLGSAMMLYGYFHPENFGGFYQPGQQDPNKLKSGQMKFLGTTFPSWMLHAPIFNVGQMGATIRQLQDKYSHKKDEDQPLSSAIWASAGGLADEEPLFKTPKDFAEILSNSKQRNYYFGELAKNTVVPGLLQFAAKLERGYNPWTEKTKNPPELKNIKEHVESGIPGVTELVPNKKPKGEKW